MVVYRIWGITPEFRNVCGEKYGSHSYGDTQAIDDAVIVNAAVKFPIVLTKGENGNEKILYDTRPGSKKEFWL